jgi:hypothetical protein
MCYIKDQHATVDINWYATSKINMSHLMSIDVLHQRSTCHSWYQFISDYTSRIISCQLRSYIDDQPLTVDASWCPMFWRSTPHLMSPVMFCREDKSRVICCQLLWKLEDKSPFSWFLIHYMWNMVWCVTPISPGMLTKILQQMSPMLNTIL